MEHALQALVDDYRDLVPEGWIVSHAIGNHGGHHVAVTVGMLQPFAVKRGAAGGAADQKTAAARVSGGPRQVAHALKAKHRIKNVKRDHRHVVGLYEDAAAIQEAIAPGSQMPS